MKKGTRHSEGFIFDQPPNISAIFNPTGRLNFTESKNIEERKDKQSVSNAADEDADLRNKNEHRNRRRGKGRCGIEKTNSMAKFLKKLMAAGWNVVERDTNSNRKKSIRNKEERETRKFRGRSQD